MRHRAIHDRENHESVGRDQWAAFDRFSMIGSIYSLFIFILSTAIILFLYVAIDIFLADAPPNNYVEQNEWDTRWWSVPRLHSLFIVGVCCSITEVTLRCSRNGRKKRLVDRLSLDVFLLLFVGISIVQFTHPSSYRRERDATVLGVGRGNCSHPKDVFILDSVGTKISFKDTCHTFDPHQYIQINDELKNISSDFDVDFALTIVNTLYFYQSMVANVAFKKTEQNHAKSYPNAVEGLFKTKCIEVLPDLGKKNKKWWWLFCLVKSLDQIFVHSDFFFAHLLPHRMRDILQQMSRTRMFSRTSEMWRR